MTVNNFYNDLQNMASQAAPSNVDTKLDIDKALDKQSLAKLNITKQLAQTMYPQDSAARFSFWKSQINLPSLSAPVKETYWKTYEEMHPEGIVGAKRDFVDITKRELEVISGLSGKEFFLRDRLNNTPDWARKELDPILGELSAVVANANYSKSQQVYMSELDNRINRFMVTAQLDPDLPIDTHVEDVVRLEQLNLMDVAHVSGGRMGVYDKKNTFIPVFGLKSREQIFENDPYSAPSAEEQSVVRDLSPSIIRKAVEGNVLVARSKIKIQERTAIAVATKYLEDGAYPMDRWDSAFAMLSEVPIREKIGSGIKGEIASGRIKTEQDLARTVYMAMTRYGNMLMEKK